MITTMITMITTSFDTFQRVAWTGGSRPPEDFEKIQVGRELINFFIGDQEKDCKGIPITPEMQSIFKNRALYDAWATYRNKYPEQTPEQAKFNAQFEEWKGDSDGTVGVD